jgi:hypothetical protein
LPTAGDDDLDGVKAVAIVRKMITIITTTTTND